PLAFSKAGAARIGSPIVTLVATIFISITGVHPADLFWWRVACCRFIVESNKESANRPTTLTQKSPAALSRVSMVARQVVAT
ncbi:MAG: hypothetical protein KAS94_15255, partial [Desulfobulbaceae bacterium]|nr:hypothetical protein [Desulfobulbaceae bacterium]